MNSDGNEKYLLYPEKIKEEINKLTKNGNRVILTGYIKGNFNPEKIQNIVFISLISIRDELRKKLLQELKVLKMLE